MTEMFGEAWSPMSVPDLAPDDDDDERREKNSDGCPTLIIKVQSSDFQAFYLTSWKHGESFRNKDLRIHIFDRKLR